MTAVAPLDGAAAVVAALDPVEKDALDPPPVEAGPAIALSSVTAAVLANPLLVAAADVSGVGGRAREAAASDRGSRRHDAARGLGSPDGAGVTSGGDPSQG